MRVLVTGASGYIGQHVVRALAGAGREVIALTRRPTALSHAARTVRVVGRAFSEDPPVDLLERGMSVIHLAAVRNHPGHTAEEFERINLTATKRLGRASRDAGVSRFVHVGTSFGTAGEADPYAWSKIRGMEELEAIERLPLVIILPAIVFGPAIAGARNRITEHIRFVLRSRVVPTIGAGEAERNLVYVDDVVRAILEAERSSVGGRHLIAGENITPAELDRKVAQICSLTRTTVRIPVRAAFLAARIADILRRFERQCGYRHRLETLVQAWPVEGGHRSEIQRDITPLDEGLRRAIASLRKVR